MDYDYMPFHREKDFHNRCCGGKLWCIKAKSYEHTMSNVPLRVTLINLIDDYLIKQYLYYFINQ